MTLNIDFAPMFLDYAGVKRRRTCRAAVSARAWKATRRKTGGRRCTTATGCTTTTITMCRKLRHPYGPLEADLLLWPAARYERRAPARQRSGVGVVRHAQRPARNAQSLRGSAPRVRSPRSEGTAGEPATGSGRYATPAGVIALNTKCPLPGEHRAAPRNDGSKQRSPTGLRQ